MYAAGPFYALGSVARQRKEEGLVRTVVSQDGKETSPLGVTSGVGGEGSRRGKRKERERDLKYEKKGPWA